MCYWDAQFGLAPRLKNFFVLYLSEHEILTAHKTNKRADGPWIAHLNPGTLGYDVLACGLRNTIQNISIFSTGGHL